MAEIYLNWSGMLHPIGRANESIARADLGLELLEPYLRAEPDDLAVREINLKLHGNRAYALAAAGRHLEAAGERTKVIELSPQPVPPGYRIRLAVDLLRAGETERAMIQAQLLKPAPEVSAYDRYNLGCLYCLCAVAAQSDKHAAPEVRTRLFRRSTNRESAWLVDVRRLGGLLPESREPRICKARFRPRDPGANRDEFRKLVDSEGGKP
jgi:tetratricopeptide (TPR) repeat protein